MCEDCPWMVLEGERCTYDYRYPCPVHTKTRRYSRECRLEFSENVTKYGKHVTVVMNSRGYERHNIFEESVKRLERWEQLCLEEINRRVVWNVEKRY